ncbi:LexA family protein [Chromobacterium amazonense]|uniref:Peptidase S24 n=1 Tax=Chromobacterium amazonense TaxID=1382803 RepID=A0A1S1WY38_9NEIS|nr:translesion error-prone DNA polymerase V autoproteolytic subunit [Chromobacterium amazonense]MDQ4539951.1 translesion error-prone DNA polymerase V autoproteolytic subunit [Chromobacterium amazonense]OHX11978.1 peptidase S24 [Chromobacterium amazonense]PRP70685.1 peptidase S24 [Chromobacterium amazonense]
MEIDKPNQHGGKRSGAGRKSAFGGDKTVAVRVPEPLRGILQQWLEDYRSWRTVNSEQAFDFRTLGAQLSELSLPLFAGSVPAGSPVAADDMKEADIDLNTHLVNRPGDTFMVRVKGDSMQGAGIHDGDLLLVERVSEPRNGKVVVAALNGELTVKRLERGPDGLRLLPENPAYQPITVPEDASFHIWGVVTNVIHKVD